MKHFSFLIPFIAPLALSAQSFLDPTFGTGGYVNLSVSNMFEQFHGIVVQPDGRIVVAGHAALSAKTHPLVARFTSDGVLDPSFSSGGWSLGPGPDWYDPVRACLHAFNASTVVFENRGSAFRAAVPTTSIASKRRIPLVRQAANVHSG